MIDHQNAVRAVLRLIGITGHRRSHVRNIAAAHALDSVQARLSTIAVSAVDDALAESDGAPISAAEREAMIEDLASQMSDIFDTARSRLPPAAPLRRE